MRELNQLLHSRTRLRPRYALFPLEGYPTSRIPAWKDAEIRVLCAPVMGAQFTQYKIELKPGGGTKQASDGRVETFAYILNGAANFTIDGKSSAAISGGFMLVPCC